MITIATVLATRFFPDLVSQCAPDSCDEDVIHDDPIKLFGNYVEIEMTGDELILCDNPDMNEWNK
jgi:hypothetical protein